MSKEKYKQFIESIELNEIELLSLKCNQNKNFTTEKRENIELALKNDIVDTEIDGMGLQVQIQFGVVAFNPGDSSHGSVNVEDMFEDDILFKVEFSLILSYVFDLEDSEDILKKFDNEIETFTKKNVPLNAWPYARETISSITTRMGFPAVIIPTYKNLSSF